MNGPVAYCDLHVIYSITITKDNIKAVKLSKSLNRLITEHLWAIEHNFHGPTNSSFLSKYIKSVTN